MANQDMTVAEVLARRFEVGRILGSPKLAAQGILQRRKLIGLIQTIDKDFKPPEISETTRPQRLTTEDIVERRVADLLWEAECYESLERLFNQALDELISKKQLAFPGTVPSHILAKTRLHDLGTITEPLSIVMKAGRSEVDPFGSPNYDPFLLAHTKYTNGLLELAGIFPVTTTNGIAQALMTRAAYVVDGQNRLLVDYSNARKILLVVNWARSRANKPPLQFIVTDQPEQLPVIADECQSILEDVPGFFWLNRTKEEAHPQHYHPASKTSTSLASAAESTPIGVMLLNRVIR